MHSKTAASVCNSISVGYDGGMIFQDGFEVVLTQRRVRALSGGMALRPSYLGRLLRRLNRVLLRRSRTR